MLPGIVRSTVKFSINILLVSFDSLDAGGLSGLNFFVTSTFGNGDPPKMAQRMSAWLEEQLTHRDVTISKRISLAPVKDSPPGFRKKIISRFNK